jgi:hypothetical protein
MEMIGNWVSGKKLILKISKFTDNCISGELQYITKSKKYIFESNGIILKHNDNQIIFSCCIYSKGKTINRQEYTLLKGTIYKLKNYMDLFIVTYPKKITSSKKPEIISKKLKRT